MLLRRLDLDLHLRRGLPSLLQHPSTSSFNLRWSHVQVCCSRVTILATFFWEHILTFSPFYIIPLQFFLNIVTNVVGIEGTMVNVTEYTVPLHLGLVPMIMAELSATTVIYLIQSIVIQSYHTIYIKHGSKKKCQNRSLSSLIQVHINSYSNMNSTGSMG